MASISLPATAGAEAMLFYHDSKRGWFWYENPPQEPEPETPNEPKTRPTPSLRVLPKEELWDMHPDDFQALLMGLQKEAVRRPTEQNVFDYLVMQDMARRKAAAYANVAAYVTQKHNEFDMTQAYPVAAPGVRAKTNAQQEEIAATIAGARGEHALLFFTNPACSFCTEQKQILSHFTERYKWEIKVINTGQEPEIAARFDVRITPTLLLIKKGKPDHLIVSTGVVSLDELERTLYRSIRLLRGDIKPEEYSVYEFQKGGPLDPTSVLERKRKR